MNNNIIKINNEVMDVRYDCDNGNHFVYVGLGDQVRRIMFSSAEPAIKLIDSLACYTKLKLKVK